MQNLTVTDVDVLYPVSHFRTQVPLPLLLLSLLSDCWLLLSSHCQRPCNGAGMLLRSQFSFSLVGKFHKCNTSKYIILRELIYLNISIFKETAHQLFPPSCSKVVMLNGRWSLSSPFSFSGLSSLPTDSFWLGLSLSDFSSLSKLDTLKERWRFGFGLAILLSFSLSLPISKFVQGSSGSFNPWVLLSLSPRNSGFPLYPFSLG